MYCVSLDIRQILTLSEYEEFQSKQVVDYVRSSIGGQKSKQLMRGEIRLELGD